MEQPFSANALGQMRIAVLGAGRSGVAAAGRLRRLGARIFLSDAQPISIPLMDSLNALGIETESCGHSDRVLNSDLIIVSPGVAWRHPLLEKSRLKGIPVWGELELGYRLCPSQNLIAITGTNGKSTTTRLTAALLRAQRLPVAMGGNLGTPFCELLDNINESTWVVLEVSSFQLESAQAFSPRIGVWLNLSPDHLNRHGDMDRYRALKTKLFANQGPNDHAVLGADLALPSGCLAQRHSILPEMVDADGLFPHQQANLAAALLTARLANKSCDLADIDWAYLLKQPHCLEDLGEVGGVRYYNDSKATNPRATIAALESLKSQGPLCLILGGDHKGAHDPSLGQYLVRAEHVAQIVFVGALDKVWQTTLETALPEVWQVHSFKDALQTIVPDIRTCVLSPAAASFDRFANYMARGDAFRQAVAKLRQTAAVS